MAWKWFEITSYKVSEGGQGDYYGGVQLMGDGFLPFMTGEAPVGEGDGILAEKIS